MATVMKVSFEQVSAIRHPEYYRGDHPCVSADQVPDEDWTRTEREGDGARDQYNGLLRLMAAGELIRDVHLYEAEAVATTWREVTPGGES